MLRKFEKGTKEYQMFLDFWNLCQKHWEPERSDEYWNLLIADVDDFVKRHKTCLMASYLGLALINTQEERTKEIS